MIISSGYATLDDGQFDSLLVGLPRLNCELSGGRF